MAHEMNTGTVKKHWEHFAHDADIGVRGVGASKADAFEQAAVALTAVITDPQALSLREKLQISCEAPGTFSFTARGRRAPSGQDIPTCQRHSRRRASRC